MCFKRIEWKWMLLAIILLALSLRLAFLFEKEYGVDEAFTVSQIKMPFPEMINKLAFEDTHPPLYHLLAKIFFILGGIPLAKMVSVLSGLGLIIFSFLFFRESFGENTALVAALLLAVNPFSVAYSQHMRPFMLFAFLFMVLLYQLKKFMGKQNYWNLFSIACLNALLLLTNYHGFFVLLSETAFLLFFFRGRQNFYRVLLIIAISLLLFLPGMYFLLPNLGIVSGRTYTPRSLTDFSYVFYKLSIGANISSIQKFFPALFAAVPIALGLFFAGTVKLYREKKPIYFLLFFFWLPLLSAFFAGQLFSVIFYFRYFIYLLPLFILPIAFFLSETGNRNVRFGLLAALFVSWIAVLILYYGIILQADWNSFFGL